MILGSGGGGGGNYAPGFLEDNKSGSKQSQITGEEITDFVQRHWDYVVLGIIFFLAIVIILVVLKVICQAGLIKSVQDIINSRPTSFKKGFQDGKRYFYQLFLLNLFISLFTLLVALALITPVVFLFLLKAFAWAILLGIFAAIFIVVLATLAFFLRKYANLYLVMSGLGIKSALERAFELLRKNLAASINFFLLMLASVILFFVLLALLFALLLMVPSFFIPGYTIHSIVLIPLVLFAFLILAIVLLAESVFEVFYQSAWILFFQEIAAAPDKKPAKEEMVKIAQKALNPEEV